MTLVVYNRGPTVQYISSRPQPTNSTAQKQVRFALPAQTSVKRPTDTTKPSKKSESRRPSTRDPSSRDSSSKPVEKNNSKGPVLVAAGLSYVGRSLDVKKSKSRATTTPKREKRAPLPPAPAPPPAPRRLVVWSSDRDSTPSKPSGGNGSRGDHPKYTYVYRKVVWGWY